MSRETDKKAEDLKKTSKRIQDILDDLAPLLSAHDCTMELGEVSGNRVIIYCGGEGALCDSKCVEDVIKQKFPRAEIIYR